MSHPSSFALRRSIAAGLCLGLLCLASPADAQVQPCKAVVNCAVSTALSRLPVATPCNGASLCAFVSNPTNQAMVDGWFASGGACNAFASTVQGFNPKQLVIEAMGCAAAAGGARTSEDFQRTLCTLSPEAFLTDAVAWLVCDAGAEVVRIVGEIGAVVDTISGNENVVYQRGDRKVVFSSIGISRVFKTTDGCGWITDCETCSKTVHFEDGGPSRGQHCLWVWDGRVHKVGDDFEPLARCAQGEPFGKTGRLDGRVVVAEETRVSGTTQDILPPLSLPASCANFRSLALASMALEPGAECVDQLSGPTIDVAELRARTPDVDQVLRAAGFPDIAKLEFGVPIRPCREGMACLNKARRKVTLFPAIQGLNLEIERDLDVGRCSEVKEVGERCGEPLTICHDGLICLESRCAQPRAGYELAFTTGKGFGAGTDAKILVVLEGSGGTSELVHINPLIRGNAFEAGQTDRVQLTVRNVGAVKKIHIVHQNLVRGFPDPWTLASVTVRQAGRTLGASCQCALNGDRRVIELK